MAGILLRRTTREQVAAVFPRFINRFPNPESLADAAEEEISDIIRPLGLHKLRGKILNRVGKVLSETEHFPQRRDDILKIPGVGPYAANAVSCLAFNEDVVLMDVNVERILTQFFNITHLKAGSSSKPLAELAQELIPKGRAREFNLAMLDLAHKICVPRKPCCNICPLAEGCAYVGKNTVKFV